MNIERHQVDDSKERAKRAKRYAEKHGEPAVRVIEKMLRNNDKAQDELLRNNDSRAEYMREYRKRPKKCPHCGGEL